MADDFQYVKMPDGSYGKFAADATPDFMRSAITSRFPDAFAPKQRPDFSVHPPKIHPPPLVRKSESGQAAPVGMTSPDDEDAAFDQTLGKVATDTGVGMVKDSGRSLLRTSGPNVAYQGARMAVGAKPHGLGMPTTSEAMITGIMSLLGQAEGAGTVSGAGVLGREEGAVAASAARGGKVPLVRSPEVTAPTPSPGAATGPSLARDVMDVVKPSIGHRVDAGSRLLKRFQKGPAEVPLTDVSAPGSRGGFPAPTEAESAASYRQQEYNAPTGSTRSPSLQVGEANPPHDPSPAHTPSGGARQTLQRTGDVPTQDMPGPVKLSVEEETRPRGPVPSNGNGRGTMGENKVPVADRASSRMKKADQEAIAAKVEGRGAAKAALEKSEPQKAAPAPGKASTKVTRLRKKK